MLKYYFNFRLTFLMKKWLKHCKLDNIPFYAPLVAPDDIIFAEFDEHQQMINLK